VPDPDVIVVGAGAGGLAAAWRLTTQGVRVTLLEGGRRYEPETDYPQTQDHFERLTFPYDAEYDEAGRPRYGFGASQRLPESLDAYRSHDKAHGQLVPGRERRYAQYSHVRGVGGSTLHYQAEAHRYHPDSLRMRSRFGVGADWPLDPADLERYYDLAEVRIGVAAPPDVPQRPRSTPPPLPPHPLSYASQQLAPAFRAVGTTLVPNSLAILSGGYDGRPACNYCNACSSGCPRRDKGSADVTFLPAAVASGRLDLRSEARVQRVEVSRGRASGVVYVDAQGREQRVGAQTVLLAGGAIETPRLLLDSGGVANASGQVGRHLTETLLWTSVGLLPIRVDAHRGVPIDGSAWELAVPTQREGYAGGFRLATSHGMAGLRGPAHYAEYLVPGFGVEHQRRMAEVYGRGVAITAVGEWLPNQGTFVDLDPTRRDGFGRPVARIHSRLDANELALARHMGDTVRGVMDAAGAEVVSELTTLDVFLATHVLGTCRMGANPELSVADADGFSHEVPNLGFADGSLVPSSGAGDSPSLTISALAIRTADKAIARSR
jgi:choline dehydrogenase-like flavoprotein